jgi:hypothetical protein
LPGWAIEGVSPVPGGARRNAARHAQLEGWRSSRLNRQAEVEGPTLRTGEQELVCFEELLERFARKFGLIGWRVGL